MPTATVWQRKMEAFLPPGALQATWGEKHYLYIYVKNIYRYIRRAFLPMWPAVPLAVEKPPLFYV